MIPSIYLLSNSSTPQLNNYSTSQRIFMHIIIYYFGTASCYPLLLFHYLFTKLKFNFHHASRPRMPTLCGSVRGCSKWPMRQGDVSKRQNHVFHTRCVGVRKNMPYCLTLRHVANSHLLQPSTRTYRITCTAWWTANKPLPTRRKQISIGNSNASAFATSGGCFLVLFAFTAKRFITMISTW